MSKVVDQLITQFILDSKDYDKGAKSVMDSTKNLDFGLTGTFGRLKDKVSGLLVGMFAGVGASIGVSGFGNLIGQATDLSMKYDTVSRSLDVLTGSARRARELVKFADELAKPTVFTGLELAEAARQLEAYGLHAEKFLPVVTQLGQTFGGSKEAVLEFARALAYLNAGRSGEAMESLARGGITREQLMKRGVTFNGAGEMTSDRGKALDAVVALVNEKFARGSETVGQGFAAKFSTFRNAIEQTLRPVGDTVLNFLVSPLSRVGDVLNRIVESGQVERIAAGFAGLFSIDGTTLERGVRGVFNFLERMPPMLKQVMTVGSQAFGMLANGLKIVVALQATYFAMQNWGLVVQGVRMGITVFTALTNVIRGAATMQATLNAFMGPAGWAQIAAGIGIAVATYAALDGILQGVGSEIGALTADAADFSTELFHAKNVLDELKQKQSDLRKEIEKSGKGGAADKVAELKVEYEKLSGAIDAASQAVLNLSIRQDIAQKQKQIRDIVNKQAEVSENPAAMVSYVVSGEAEANAKKVAELEKEINQDVAQLKRLPKLKNSLAKAEAANAGSAGNTGQSSPQAATQTTLLSQIRDNTKSMATDFRRFSVGGGELGQIGVTPVEVERHYGAGAQGGPRTTLMRAGGGPIARALVDAIVRYVQYEAAQMQQDVSRNRGNARMAY